jgi:hypothetical protein
MSRTQTIERHAWQYLKRNLKNFPVRGRLDLIFHANAAARAALDKDYEIRNDAAHDYRLLPKKRRTFRRGSMGWKAMWTNSKDKSNMISIRGIDRIAVNL